MAIVQQQALTGSSAASATHLVKDPLSAPEAMLSRIAHKHVALGILPEQYDVLYTYLLESIAAELSDVITAEIAAAWTEVYWLMAHALIKQERASLSPQPATSRWHRGPSSACSAR